MSLYNDASLVMIPSAYKDGKLYSIKPTDGSGDFTFSRGSNLAATRVDENGLIEKGRENLLLQSNQFDTTWTTSNVSVTGGQSGYDGSNDAWLISNTATNGYLEQTPSLSASIYTYSVYVKKGSGADTTFRMRVQGAANNTIEVDIVSGTLSFSVGNVISTSIDDVGGGWFRIQYSVNDSVSYVRLDTRGDNTNSIYIQDAQLEYGLVATDYIETTTTTTQVGILEDMPRLDYSGGASCPSLLLEPQRSNLITQSEYINGWVKERVSITDNVITSPDGYTNAAKIDSDSTPNTTHQVYIGPYTNTIGNVVFSGFFKKGEYDWVHFGGGTANSKAWFNLNTGIIGSKQSDVVTHSMEDFGNGWYRCISVVNFTTTGNYAEFGPANVDGSRVISGTPSGGIYCWGIQFEDSSSYPTSYIPCYGAATTRSEDSCTKTGVSSLIGQEQGTIFIEVGEVHNNSATAATKWFMEIRKDSNNSFGFGSGGADSAPTIRFVTQISGVASTDAEPAGFSNSKIAIRYTEDDFKIYQNGVLQSTIAKSIGGYVDIEFMEGAGDDLLMPIKQFSVFPTALTDSECIALTQ